MVDLILQSQQSCDVPARSRSGPEDASSGRRLTAMTGFGLDGGAGFHAHPGYLWLGIVSAGGRLSRCCGGPPRTVDSFTDAVFEAEGMGDMSYTDLRRQVRDVVARHMSGWPGEGLAAQ